MDNSRLSSLNHLTYFALRGTADMRPTLLRVLTDLYMQKLTHTPDEERHYTELALRLLDAVDTPTRAAVAARLARHMSPPVQVIERLAADLPEIAAPLIAHPALQRKSAAAETTAQVVAAAEVDEAAEATVATVEPVPPAQEQPLPAATPGTLVTAIASELNELFFAANAHERRLILLNLHIAAPLPMGRISIAHDAEVGKKLEAAALAGNRENFALHLAHALQIPQAQARRIADDDLGEPVVTSAKALAMPRDVLYRILLFANTAVGHSVERVHTLATLYDELTLEAAEHMVSIWQALRPAERKQGQYRPLFWNDEARVRARAATTAVRRAPSTQWTNARRDAS